ncbi:MAG: response regulator transcription factor [Sedimentisphaerales bacterium]|nr:response regulator transcription factor [Sedimentisphaerales bacterium]
MASESTVFVVDDDETMREGLRQLLQSVNLNIKTFASSQEFLDSYDPSSPGCLILDVRMPGMSGPKLQEELLTKNIHLPIIFISGHGDVTMVANVFKKGALDFIEKPFSSQILLDRIQDAIAKDIQFRKKLDEQESIKEKLALLTKREQEVMNLIVAGKLNKVVANELGLSQRTVEVHRANIMEKLKVGSIAELVTIVQKIGINNDLSTNHT